jgi:hypothetical protein
MPRLSDRVLQRHLRVPFYPDPDTDPDPDPYTDPDPDPDTDPDTYPDPDYDKEGGEALCMG